MIRSFSHVPAFRKAIRDSQTGGKSASYYWRKRGPNQIQVYFQGQVIAETKSTTEALFVARDHAVRMGLYFNASTPEFYTRYDTEKKEYYLYVNGRFSKRGKSREDLEDFVKAMAWMNASDNGKQWHTK